MATRLGLDFGTVGVGTLDNGRYVLSRLRSYHRRRSDADVKVVRFHPGYLVQGIAREGGAVGPAVAHIGEAGLKGTWRVAHDDEYERERGRQSVVVAGNSRYQTAIS